MQSIFVCFDKAIFADFQWKIVDVSRTQGVCHVIHTDSYTRNSWFVIRYACDSYTGVLFR